MPHVTPQQMQEWSAHHAERAHELLLGVDTALAALVAKPTPASVLSTLDQQRVELAEAHAQTALALSTAIVPFVADAPAPKPGV
jgi:hypothetical protein